ncbi:MOS1T transposase, partial [Pseudoatta argentina]
MIQKQGHWVPYELKPRDVERRFGTCELLLQRQKKKIYVGQIGRLFQRTKEHRNHINRITSNESMITQHRLEHSHDFERENMKILDIERKLNKRFISEMLNIQLQQNNLNFQSDTEFLHHSYVHLTKI